jgi:hypothetical protein
LRWRRNRQRILADTVQGLQWGFVAVGLAVGTVLFIATISSASSIPALIVAATANYLLFAAIGAVAVGSGAFVRSILRHLQDTEHPWRTLSFTALASGLVFSILFGIMVLGFSVNRHAQASPFLAAASLAVAVFVTIGFAILPLKVAWPLRLAVACLAGGVAFAFLSMLHLLGSKGAFDLWEAVLVGGGIGIGFYAGLNPVFWNRQPSEAEAIEDVERE